MDKRTPLFCQFFWGLVPTQEYLSLCQALIFLLRIGTNPSKKGEELVYYIL